MTSLHDIEEAYEGGYFEGAGGDAWYTDHTNVGLLKENTHCRRMMLQYLEGVKLDDEDILREQVKSLRAEVQSLTAKLSRSENKVMELLVVVEEKKIVIDALSADNSKMLRKLKRG